MRRYGNASPERAKVWTEPPPKLHHHHHHLQQQRRGQHQGRKVPVVYYLCRNRHLEHPHFIEVPTSSPDGLLLRDVINRLNALRGKGVTASYSWSCKRSYKNGFVWHDLSEDDLVLPSNGDEYVLKGSEILDSSPSDRPRHAAGAAKHRQRESPSPSTSRSREASPSSRGVVGKETKPPPQQLPQPLSPAHHHPPPTAAASSAPEDELSPSLVHRPTSFSGNASPGPKSQPQSAGGSSSPSPGEYRVHKAMGAADASTQTEETGGGLKRMRRPQGTHGRAISTDERPPDLEFAEMQRNRTPRSTRSCEIIRDEMASPLTSTSTFSPGGKIDTLESLIRADAARNLNSFRILEEEIPVATGGARMKPINVLMQLITCGSISVKGHHSFGLVPSYRPAFSHTEFPSSPMFSSSMMLGELSCPSKSPRMTETRLDGAKSRESSMDTEDKQGGGELVPTLKRSSSNGAEWSSKSPPPARDEDRAMDQSRSKRLPKSVRVNGNKHSKKGATSRRSPLSSPCPDYQQSPSWDPSKAGSMRMPVASPSSGSSMRAESFPKEKEKVIKIEERLTSGARVIIQSRAPCEDSDGSNSS